MGIGQRMILIPKSELIQDIKILERDVRTLSTKGVLLNGVTPENSIFNGELYLTDPTGYSVLEECSPEKLEELNKFQLHLLFTRLITLELRKNGFNSRTESEVKELFGMKDPSDNTSAFLGEIISNNDSIKQFVKKMQ